MFVCATHFPIHFDDSPQALSISVFTDSIIKLSLKRLLTLFGLLNTFYIVHRTNVLVAPLLTAPPAREPLPNVILSDPNVELTYIRPVARDSPLGNQRRSYL